MNRTERILGIAFFNGTAKDAVDSFVATGGCLVVAASPALTKLRHDESYRSALQKSDFVLPDSGLLGLLWKLISGRKLRKISGIEYLTRLLDDVAFHQDGKTFWVVSAPSARAKALQFLRAKGLSLSEEDFFVSAAQSATGKDHMLLLKIEERRPKHVVLAARSSTQEALGIYLRDFLLYRPGIHCVGAALGFLTGDEARIPALLERRHLGWLARLRAQPGMILPRLGIALTLALMVLRYRSDLPPLKTRWADL